MDWGIHLPHLGRQATRTGLIEFAQHAEQLGFHSGWVSDHVAWPSTIASQYPYADDGSFAPPVDMPWLDPLGTLFFVAGCTEVLKLGTTVLILGYRPPVLTAKAIASLDHLSEGRVILGVGVGWMREEFEILGMPYDHRGKRADEQLELFRTFFADPTPSFAGEFYDVPEVGFEPKPVARAVPIWVGGDSEAAFRRVARYGDAYHAAFQQLDTVEANWARVRELVAEAGRDAGVRANVDPPLPRSAGLDAGGQVDRRFARRDARHGRPLAGHRRRPHPPRPGRFWRPCRPPGGDGTLHARRRAPRLSRPVGAR